MIDWLYHLRLRWGRRRGYRHAGYVWRQPAMASLEQYEGAKQVLFEAMQSAQSSNLAGAWSEFTRPDRWSRFLASVLERGDGTGNAEENARLLRTFPAEWAEEVTSRFFLSGQRSSGWLLAASMIPPAAKR